MEIVGSLKLCYSGRFSIATLQQKFNPRGFRGTSGHTWQMGSGSAHMAPHGSGSICFSPALHQTRIPKPLPYTHPQVSGVFHTPLLCQAVEGAE